MIIEPIVYSGNKLSIIDQRKLPDDRILVKLNNITTVYNAIKKLKIRGAPAIGIVAAYGIYIHSLRLADQKKLNRISFKKAVNYLNSSRPTAVNLAWALDRMLSVFDEAESNSPKNLLYKLEKTARSIHHEDKEHCRKIGLFGSELIKDNSNILTHCNAGILATGGIGTALAPIYTAIEQKKDIHVYVDETRPVGQGARLTFWELNQNQVPATLITDNMAASLFADQKIDLVIVGADRIASNGDVANKIGTYNLAVLAHFHKVPFYVAAPSSTLDLKTKSGKSIPIELRDSNEVLSFWRIKKAKNYEVWNPAFDITPSRFISGLITEKGIITKPFRKNIINQFT